MARPKPGTSPPCPFCGAPPHDRANERGYIDWQCGSHQYGKEPWQSANCEHNVEVDKLERQIASHETTIADLEKQLAKQQAEMERLRAIVATLPKDGDGKPIGIGAKGFTWYRDKWVPTTVDELSESEVRVSSRFGDGDWIDASDFHHDNPGGE